MTLPVVEISGVTKTFDDIVAVNRVTLRVDQGQTLGLIGPNGAGKTTLLRIIATLARPDAGDVRVDGQSVCTHPRSVRRKLGFMPAEFGSPRGVTIGEYLEYFGCMYGISRADRHQRIADVCELTDLSGREDVLVNGLSTGNRQRLLLAKTLLHDPRLLVLDEPASGLDPRTRTELRAIVKELASMGKTIIISSHILPDLEDISDRIAILEAGKLVVDGDLAALRARDDSARRVIKLRVASDEIQRVRKLLIALDGVTSCERRDQFLVMNVDQANGNFVLEELLKNEVHVLHFSEDEPNLEEIFMRTTAGHVT